MYTSFVVFTVLSGLLSAFTRCSLSQGLHNDAMQCPLAENSGGSIHGACYHQILDYQARLHTWYYNIFQWFLYQAYPRKSRIVPPGSFAYSTSSFGRMSLEPANWQGMGSSGPLEKTNQIWWYIIVLYIVISFTSSFNTQRGDESQHRWGQSLASNINQ